MAIRQETYIIYIRPHIEITVGSSKSKLFVKDGIAMLDPLAGSANKCPYIPIFSVEGTGVWLKSFESTSLDKIRVQYKRLLEKFGKAYIRVEKVVPVDTLITPIK